MAIYTKRGDRGETSLYDKASSQKIRISKDSLRINAIGSVDELNSYLGVVAVKYQDSRFKIQDIQADLFRIGAILAGAGLRFSKVKTRKFEKEIDRLEGSLPVVRNFILPGGSEVAAELHFARSLVRRAERAIVALNKQEPISPEILVYINRLSDFLYIKAREINHKEGKTETTWSSKVLK